MTSRYEKPDGQGAGAADAEAPSPVDVPEVIADAEAIVDGLDSDAVDGLDSDAVDGLDSDAVDGLDGDEEVAEEVIDAEVVEEDRVVGEDGADADPPAAPLDPVAQANAERDEYLDALRRLQADFENYRKRVVKQQAEEAGRGALALVDKLLPVLDTLDQAAAHLGDPQSADARALLAASSQLNDVLGKAGLERVDPAGELFDPNAHEAVGHLPAEPAEPAEPADSADPARSADGDPDSAAPEADSDGLVVGQVMRAGYRWKGNVVRPAMVMVRG